jgi:hypothetical protein
MVLAFLRAELDSPRHFTQYLEPILSANGLSTAIMEDADLADQAENRIRAAILGAYRGFRQGHSLFAGFPSDARWRLVALTLAEINDLRYARCNPWIDLSNGSLSVRDGAENIETVSTSVNTDILELAREIEAGNYPDSEMIVAAESPLSRHILVEGHTRATAYAVANPPVDEVEVIVGYSKGLSDWAWL